MALHTDVVPELMAPRHRRPRLLGIELPGMEVEHDRLALDRVDPADRRLDEAAREQPEVAAPTDREVRPEEPEGADRELDQGAVAVAPDLIREPRGAPVKAWKPATAAPEEEAA